MTSRGEKRKRDDNEPEHEDSEEPVLKPLEFQRNVRLYENLGNRETLHCDPDKKPEERIAEEFMHRVVLRSIQVDRKGHDTLRESRTAHGIVEVVFEGPACGKVVLSVDSSGDGGWHQTRILRRWSRTPLGADKPVVSGMCEDEYNWEKKKLFMQGFEAKGDKTVQKACNIVICKLEGTVEIARACLKKKFDVDDDNTASDMDLPEETTEAVKKMAFVQMQEVFRRAGFTGLK